MSTRDAVPPNPPWEALEPAQPLQGYLSFYFSDDLSPLAVRAVTLVNNNKSDPNLETNTYGLFSTCAHGMRASVVTHRIGVIFFITRRKGRRVLTGYYRIRWYAPGSLNRSPPDYALAADKVRFVHPPIEVDDLPKALALFVAKPFRIYKRVDAKMTAELLRVFDKRKDTTAQYLAEIDRLERFNKAHSGYRYVGWKQDLPFSWGWAREYLKTAKSAAGATRSSTSSPSDKWLCVACNEVTTNKALLRRCPFCHKMNTLRPISTEMTPHNTK